jgi:hypothetical protein
VADGGDDRHWAGGERAEEPLVAEGEEILEAPAAGEIVRSSSQLATGNRVDVELGAGGFGAKVDETR